MDCRNLLGHIYSERTILPTQYAFATGNEIQGTGRGGVGANLLSAGGAIAMALYGLDYWALVTRPVMLTSFIAFGAWLRCRWIPGRPEMSVGAKEMLQQGLHNAIFLITDYIAGSSDRIAVGYRSGAIPLGYYQNAMFIYENLCALLILSAHNVAVASLV